MAAATFRLVWDWEVANNTISLSITRLALTFSLFFVCLFYWWSSKLRLNYLFKHQMQSWRLKFSLLFIFLQIMLGVQQLFLLTAIYRGLYCYGGDQSKKNNLSDFYRFHETHWSTAWTTWFVRYVMSTGFRCKFEAALHCTSEMYLL